jgi:CheY-like chemotaxis protein
MARFLVVDDDRWTVEAMTRLLRDDGHEVVAHTSGADAVATLANEKFDAVISDLEMPVVDGRKVAKAVRVLSPEACVVLTTTHHAKDHPEHACLMVEKPVDYEALTGAITHCRAHGGHASDHCHRRSPGHGAKLSQLRRR